MAQTIIAPLLGFLQFIILESEAAMI